MVEIISGSDGGGGYSFVDVDTITMSGDGQSSSPLRNEYAQRVYEITDNNTFFSTQNQGNYLNYGTNNTIRFITPTITNGSQNFGDISTTRILVYTRSVLLIDQNFLPVHYQGASDSTFGSTKTIQLTQINAQKVYEFIYLKALASPTGTECWLCLNTLAVPFINYDFINNPLYTLLYYGTYIFYDTSETPLRNTIVIPQPNNFDGMKITIMNYTGNDIEIDTVAGATIYEPDLTTTYNTILGLGAKNTIIEIISTNNQWILTSLNSTI